MTIKNNLVLTLISAAMTMGISTVVAQNSNPSNLTSSPYTRYGFGKIGSVGNASTRAMGDVGIALRTNQFTNLNNPASLTAIDTLTMLFDVAVDAEMAAVSENGTSEKSWNAGFSYISFHFPLWNRFAGAISYSPYSMVGYEYGNEVEVPVENALINNDTLTYTNSYSGNGGLQHAQLSLAWNPIKSRTQQLNVGVTAGYICGTVDHAGSIYVSSGQGNSTYTSRNFTCKGWDVLFGAQYTRLLAPEKSVTLGLTFAPSTKIGSKSEVVKLSSKDTTQVHYSSDLSAPMKFGVGLSYQVDRKLTLTAEYAFENWAKVAGLDANMRKSDDVYQNINRIAAGAEYRPKTYGQNYLHTCIYRVGASVKDNYVKTFGKQKEYTATCGIGLPVSKRSMLNLSVAYTHLQPEKSTWIKEDYLHMTVGITFNEMMFYRSRLR